MIRTRAHIGFIASIVIGGSLAGCGKDPDTSAVATPRDPSIVLATKELVAGLKTGAPQTAMVRDALRVPARVEVDETRLARVGSPVTGRLTDLDAIVGQVVRRGQVLATINSTELSNAQLGFLKAYSQRQLAERAAARALQLLDADVIGTAELQRRQSELVQADAEVSAARGQLKVLGMPEGAIAKLAESRTVNSLTTITSSIAGTVIERKVTEGQVVQPADGIFLVADLARVWVVADVPEQAAGAVRVGEAVEAEIAALPGRRFVGTLSFVAPTVNPETRTVRARMDIPNPAGDLKPAMLATVVIKGKPERQMVVPSSAVVRDENREFVFVRIGEDKFQLRAASFGAEHEGMRVVAGGLKETDTIVFDGAFHLNNERKQRLLGGSN